MGKFYDQIKLLLKAYQVCSHEQLLIEVSSVVQTNARTKSDIMQEKWNSISIIEFNKYTPLPTKSSAPGRLAPPCSGLVHDNLTTLLITCTAKCRHIGLVLVHFPLTPHICT